MTNFRYHQLSNLGPAHTEAIWVRDPVPVLRGQNLVGRQNANE
jgi:hypothetical protein